MLRVPFRSMATGRVYQSIQAKLSAALQPSQLTIEDESHKHAGHSAMRGKDPVESHFKVTIVSTKFDGLNRLARHRLVYGILDQEMKDSIHALNMVLKTPTEASPSA
eukprot:TRINITY_DN4073_c0_g1_i1.p1 TRINITY_DN4073_c0_g1~~TRINITY_DN4073_c0_g1_i1.p1  ORF type:complete len:107 (+),score=27.96 TRINITY_DN4073_c0_g1_i1:63-383(+)